MFSCIKSLWSVYSRTNTIWLVWWLYYYHRNSRVLNLNLYFKAIFFLVFLNPLTIFYWMFCFNLTLAIYSEIIQRCTYFTSLENQPTFVYSIRYHSKTLYCFYPNCFYQIINRDYLTSLVSSKTDKNSLDDNFFSLWSSPVLEQYTIFMQISHLVNIIFNSQVIIVYIKLSLEEA